MVFHILSMAHSIANFSNPTDPFTNKAMLMSRMLKEAGHIVYFYGVEGSKVICDEMIPVVDEKTFYKTYPTVEDSRKGDYKSADGNAWKMFHYKAPIEIHKRVKDPKSEFLLCFGGYHHKQIADKVGLIAVEPGIGYPGTFANYRIFESYAWMNWVYGREDTNWPSHYNTVIPNYYFPDMYKFDDQKDDYFMFMGRLTWGKGLSVAYDLAKYFNKKLIIAGPGKLDEVIQNADPKYYEYVGVLDMEGKNKYLSKARVFFCPSLYVEPFGHIVPEASFCGTPIICTDFGAFSETVHNGVNGYRCNTFNDFVKGVENIDKISPRACRDFAEQNFSKEVLLPKYEKYFNDLLTLHNDPQGWYKVTE